jgi:hypothetical protein
MSVSYSTGDAITAAVFNAGTYTGATTLYLALYTSAPGPSNTGTEASFTNYARQAVTFGTVTSHQVTNTGAVTFPTSGSSGANITYAALMKTVSGTTAADLVTYTSLTAAIPVSSGTVISAAAGALIGSTS